METISPTAARPLIDETRSRPLMADSTMILVLTGGLGSQGKPLYSSLPLTPADPEPKLDQQHAPKQLPTNMFYSDITALPSSSPVSVPPSFTFQDLFHPPSNLEELRFPQTRARTISNKVMPWYNAARLPSRLWSDASGQSIRAKSVPVSHWLNYTLGSQMDATNEGAGEEATLTTTCGEPSCVSNRKRKREFTQLHTSFAPSYDQSGALLSDAERSSVLWTYQLADQFALHFNADDSSTRANGDTSGGAADSWDESYVGDLDLLAAEPITVLDQEDASRPPKISRNDPYRSISLHLSALYAQQRDKRLNAVSKPSLRPISDQGTGMGVDHQEISNGNHITPLIDSLTSLIADAPPHAIAKRRQGSNAGPMDQLTVSALEMTVEPDSYGTRTLLDVSSQGAARPRVPAPVPALSARNFNPAIHSIPRSARGSNGSFPSSAGFSRNNAETRPGDREPRFGSSQAQSSPRSHGPPGVRPSRRAESRRLTGTATSVLGQPADRLALPVNTPRRTPLR